jgi:hypothetical protein
MERLSASDNLIIEFAPEHWRLLRNGGADLTVLAEASPGVALRYTRAFAAQRSLPGGEIGSADVERIVLGWSASDARWHLGLMLGPALASARGSRWCGLATWPETQPASSPNDGALVDAGRQLARHLDRPFLVVPPKNEAPTSVPAVAAVEPAAPPLPYVLDTWRLESAPDGMRLTLSSQWKVRRLLRAAWYLLWGVVFIILSVTSLTAGIAPPQPAFLPYVGFLCALLLIPLAGYTALTAVRRVSIVHVDAHNRQARGLRGQSPVWQVARAEVDSVYVSAITSKVSPRKRIRSTSYGELSLLLRDGRFIVLADGVDMDTQQEVADNAPFEMLNEDAVELLTPYAAHHTLMWSALRIADALDVPARYDRRVR